MDEHRPDERIVSTDLVASVERAMAVAALRYFDRAGSFADALRAATRVTLPEPLEARESADAQLILAWRSPTETLCVARSAGDLAGFFARLGTSADGCIVDLSGGVRIVRVTGDRTADLLHRLGGAASGPAPGEARRSRLADVPVLALSVNPGETLLAIDRAYLPHLLAWIRETLLDFDSA